MPKYIIHIGPHKTGTKFLQGAFSSMPDALLAGSVYYPRQWIMDDTGSHLGLIRALHSSNVDGLKEEFSALNQSRYAKILLSSEDLSDLRGDNIAKLRQLIDGSPVEIVFYCRAYAQIISSSWQESVKQGSVMTLPEYVSNNCIDTFGSNLFNFNVVLNEFANVFGKDNIKTVSYEAVLRSGENLADHFAKTFLGLPDLCGRSLQRSNESLTIFESEMMRFLNSEYHVSSGRQSAHPYRAYSKCKELIDIPAITKVMRRHVKSININEGAPGFNAIHLKFMQQFGDTIVEPRFKKFIFLPTSCNIAYVSSDYLIDDESRTHFRRLRNSWIDSFSKDEAMAARAEFPQAPVECFSAGSTVSPILEFDEAWYLARYADVAEAVDSGIVGSGLEHYIRHGLREGRLPRPPSVQMTPA